MNTNISPVILNAINIMKKCFGGVNIEIIDKEISRKYPNDFCPIGYLGITISINGKRLFLKNEQCEDILINPKIAESIIYPFMPTIEELQNQIRYAILDNILNDDTIKL